MHVPRPVLIKKYVYPFVMLRSHSASQPTGLFPKPQLSLSQSLFRLLINHHHPSQSLATYIRKWDRCLKKFECRCSKLPLNVEVSLYLQIFKLSIIVLALITIKLCNNIPSLQHLVKLTHHSTQLMFWSTFTSSPVLSQRYKQAKPNME